MIKALMLAGTLALAGCVTTTSNGMVGMIDLPANLAKFTLTDLNAALADAQAHNDTVAAMCYSAVIPLIGTATSLHAPVGLVSAFQDVRDGVGGTSGAQGLLKQLEIPCGPLAADVNLTLIQMVAKFAGAVVPGGGIVGSLLP